MMAPALSDTLVFFGAAGDLAFKKIFPALQAMIKRGHLRDTMTQAEQKLNENR